MLSRILLFAVVVPAAVTSLLLWIGRMVDLRQRVPGANDGRSVRFRAISAAWGIALSYVSAQVAFHGWPRWGAMESWQWLMVLVPLAAASTSVVASFERMWMQSIVWVGLAVLCGWLLVPDFQANPTRWQIALGIAMFLQCVFFACVKNVPTYVWMISVMAAMLTSVPVLIASANATFAFLAVSVSVSIAVVGIGWWNRRTLVVNTAVGPVIATVLWGLCASGYFNDYGGVPWYLFAAIPASLCANLIVLLPIQRHWLRLAISLGGTLAILGWVLMRTLPLLELP
ncbi:MAG: hypothetical protein KDA87_26895 [Planctomycetales bacterium]|nr:hypothetical protein [Planctomycetales bacterium]